MTAGEIIGTDYGGFALEFHPPLTVLENKSFAGRRRPMKLWQKIMVNGGARVARKVGKSVPLLGTAVVIGLMGYEIKKKGLMKGVVNTALNATPVLGTAKNVIELFTGDWLADKDQIKGAKQEA
jgi:hypothetical protein